MKTFFFVSSLLVGFLCGCGDGRVKVFPVSGVVYVDGQPAADMFVYAQPLEGQNTGVPTPYAQANEKGEFSFSSYESGDGLALGKYKLTFKWKERSGMFKQDFEGPDRLKGKYADPEKSDKTFTVEKKINDIGRFDLSVK